MKSSRSFFISSTPAIASVGTATVDWERIPPDVTWTVLVIPLSPVEAAGGTPCLNWM